MSKSPFRYDDGADRQLTEQELSLLISSAVVGDHGVIWLQEQLETGGPHKTWYPSVDIYRPQLRVTLHGDGLLSASNKDVEVLQWTVATGRQKWHGNTETDINVKITPYRDGNVPNWANRVELLTPPDDTHSGRKRFDAQYKESLRPDWEEVRKPEQMPAAILDLHLHRRAERHVFVTLDKRMLWYGINPDEDKDAFIVRPSVAQRYIDLYLRAHGAYRVLPNYSVNRGLYYWLRLWSLVPAFAASWAYAVFGRESGDTGVQIHAYMHTLYARIIGMMQAYDRVGWLRYSTPTNDSRDEMLNQLNYFIVLATGVFDSIAWLATFRFHIPMSGNERQQITVRQKKPNGTDSKFFTLLDSHASALAAFLRDPIRQAQVALFYEPRDSIQHRLVLKGAHLNTGQFLSDCNVVFLDEDAARKIAIVDQTVRELLPFSKWGVMTSAETGSSLLEPYRFMGTALEFLFSFVDGALQHLDLVTWLTRFPRLTEAADQAISAGNRQNYPVFSTHYLGVEALWPTAAQ